MNELIMVVIGVFTVPFILWLGQNNRGGRIFRWSISKFYLVTSETFMLATAVTGNHPLTQRHVTPPKKPAKLVIKHEWLTDTVVGLAKNIVSKEPWSETEMEEVRSHLKSINPTYTLINTAWFTVVNSRRHLRTLAVSPILADALEDAGCDNETILKVLRDLLQYASIDPDNVVDEILLQHRIKTGDPSVDAKPRMIME